ncbi:cobalamin biosynthesis protein [Yinghuangia soli]|uniref:Cobalamin biosynthesis protein n=1 Tax=Yinghuangia soli TaxID=2908204 RepID=A0AA41PY20_9ACTN|nr:cobalamin biosynthesis protein [Yinghuangia soli]MCF2527495.1 cobalamin biosynthesis protein [Yinghuangia soli]
MRLAVGVGASRGAPAAEVEETLRTALAAAGLPWDAVAVVASAAAKRGEPAVRELAERLGAELLWLSAEQLAGQPVPNPSAAVEAAVGTPSVAEAAALAAFPDGELVIAKTRSNRRPSMCTIAVARHRVGGNSDTNDRKRAVIVR